MAIERAGITAEDIELIVVASVTPDNTTPSVATKLSNRLGVKVGTPAYDILAACSGFVYALTQADNMIRLGQVKTALVIGAESLSKIVDWTDRNTCVLFGDGAGAVVLRAKEGEGAKTDTGILATKIYADGSHYDHLKTNGGVSSTQNAGVVSMDGKEVFKYAIGSLSQAAETVTAMAGYANADIDWLIPHQANIRIIPMSVKSWDCRKKKLSSPSIITVILPQLQFRWLSLKIWRAVKSKKAIWLSSRPWVPDLPGAARPFVCKK